MKKLILTVAILVAGATFLRADDVALVTFKYGGSLHRAIFEFYEGDAPQTVENFKKLARKGFYNGLTVHRAFPHTLIQMGDPFSAHKDRSKIGTGGPGYTLPAEIHRKHILGAIAAARLPDKINLTRLSNGSQFYICLKPMPSYDGQYTVFGQVASGMETLEEISTKPVDSNDNPVERIVIQSVKIVPREKLPQLPGVPAFALAKPAPVAPAPVAPAPSKPAPSKPPPVTPAPATPAPVKPKPWWQIWPSAGAPAHAKPAPVTPAPTKPAAVTPAPVKPVTPKPTLAKPAPVTPVPATSAPVKPKPWWQIWPSAGAPAHAKPPPVTPAPAKPAVVTPAPVKPATPKPTPAKQPSGKLKPATPAPATPTPKPKAWWQIF